VGEPFSAKDVFDNIRNYGIVGAPFLFAVKIGEVTTLPEQYAYWVLLALGLVLLGLCALQSFVLTVKGVHHIVAPSGRDQAEMTGRGRLTLLLGLALPTMFATALIIAVLAYQRTAA
jgi:hypothetical protein